MLDIMGSQILVQQLYLIYLCFNYGLLCVCQSPVPCDLFNLPLRMSLYKYFEVCIYSAGLLQQGAYLKDTQSTSFIDITVTVPHLKKLNQIKDSFKHGIL